MTQFYRSRSRYAWYWHVVNICSNILKRWFSCSRRYRHHHCTDTNTKYNMLHNKQSKRKCVCVWPVYHKRRFSIDTFANITALQMWRPTTRGRNMEFHFIYMGAKRIICSLLRSERNEKKRREIENEWTQKHTHTHTQMHTQCKQCDL